MKSFLLTLFFASALRAALSDVAFTSQNEISKQTAHVTKNELFRNESPTEQTRECVFFRDFEVVYKFTAENKKHIYYFMFDCLDEAFNVLKSRVTFNYDGGENRMVLPEGCIPPTIPEPPNNPCQHGFDLGTEVIKDISTMIVKKLVNHPQEAIPDQEITVSIDSDKLDQVNQALPELESMLDKLIEENHSKNPENLKVDGEITNDDGTKTHVYNFVNGETAERTKKLNGDIETILYKNDETVEVRTEMPSGIIDMSLYNKEGIAVYHKSIEPIEDEPDFVKVTTYNYDDEIVGQPEIFPRYSQNAKPLDVDFTEEVVNKLDSANANMAMAIEKYVNERVTCFSEHLINIKENYLTFVCSTTGHSSIKDVILKNFAETLVCGQNIDCQEIEERLVDKMVTSINMGGDGHDVSVETNIKGETILDTKP